MGESSSSALDLNNPHWTETQQQQLLHEMRIPPQPHTTPEETTLVEEIKDQLQRIDDIHCYAQVLGVVDVVLCQ
jgi:hypothetical protein